MFGHVRSVLQITAQKWFRRLSAAGVLTVQTSAQNWMLEAGIRQFTAWGNTDPGRHVLIAVASPRVRSVNERPLQTADIAQRLMRGGELHEEREAHRDRDVRFWG
jgi:hypothetical protein